MRARPLNRIRSIRRIWPLASAFLHSVLARHRGRIPRSLAAIASDRIRSAPCAITLTAADPQKGQRTGSSIAIQTSLARVDTSDSATLKQSGAAAASLHESGLRCRESLCGVRRRPSGDNSRGTLELLVSQASTACWQRKGPLPRDAIRKVPYRPLAGRSPVNFVANVMFGLGADASEPPATPGPVEKGVRSTATRTSSLRQYSGDAESVSRPVLRDR